MLLSAGGEGSPIGPQRRLINPVRLYLPLIFTVLEENRSKIQGRAGREPTGGVKSEQQTEVS